MVSDSVMKYVFQKIKNFKWISSSNASICLKHFVCDFYIDYSLGKKDIPLVWLWRIIFIGPTDTIKLGIFSSQTNLAFRPWLLRLRATADYIQVNTCDWQEIFSPHSHLDLPPSCIPQVAGLHRRHAIMKTQIKCLDGSQLEIGLERVWWGDQGKGRGGGWGGPTSQQAWQPCDRINIASYAGGPKPKEFSGRLSALVLAKWFVYYFLWSVFVWHGITFLPRGFFPFLLTRRRQRQQGKSI